MSELMCMAVVLRVVLCRFWSEVQDYEFNIHNKGKYLVISLHLCVADLSVQLNVFWIVRENHIFMQCFGKFQSESPSPSLQN